jgi:chaperone required for assembly of F1-ATPase
MKRFYKNATVDTTLDNAESGDVDGGFRVLLDGRPIKTPGKNSLVMPTEKMAQSVADEWQAQDEEVDPATMPMMRFAATAVDRITTQRQAVIDEIAAFGGHDLLCYRGDDPELVKLQAGSWQPLLDWAADELGAPLASTAGIVSIDQDPASLAVMEAAVADSTDMQLSALHTMTSISGSLIIALALINKHVNLEKAWQATTVDEHFQQIKWGLDAEAEQRLITRRQALSDAVRFHALCMIS